MLSLIFQILHLCLYKDDINTIDWNVSFELNVIFASGLKLKHFLLVPKSSVGSGPSAWWVIEPHQDMLHIQFIFNSIHLSRDGKR